MLDREIDGLQKLTLADKTRYTVLVLYVHEVLCGMCVYFSFYNANVAYEALRGLHMQYHNLLSNVYFVNQIVG